MSEIIIRKNDSELLQLVTFKLGAVEFGVDIFKVKEINKVMELTQIPNIPYFVEGVVDLRGRIIPVINLRSKMGLEGKCHDSETRIIVVELKDKTVGFIVDEVKEVLRIQKAITESPPDFVVSEIESDYIISIAKLDDRLIILLDLSKVINEYELQKI